MNKQLDFERHICKRQRAHTKMRALDRFSLCLTDPDIEKWLGEIGNYQLRPLMRQDQRHQIYKICVQGVEAPAVYDKNTKEVCTILTWEIAYRDIGKEVCGVWHEQRRRVQGRNKNDERIKRETFKRLARVQ